LALSPYPNQEGTNLSHKHEIKKTHITIEEFDDVITDRLAKNSKYFGEGNSKGRILELDFEYCLDCDLRLLNNQTIMTKDILEEEFEELVIKAKKGNFVSSEKTIMQHTDFETFERLILNAVEFGKLRDKKKRYSKKI
jgi:hypothetical protein